MDYLNTIIILLTFNIQFLAFSYIISKLMHDLSKRPSSLQSYKISKIWYTVSIIIIYIVFFIMVLYYLISYGISHNIDLKIVFNDLKLFNSLLNDVPPTSKLYIIFLFAVMSIILLL